MPAEQARQDLRSKLILERKLRIGLNRLNKQLMQDFVKRFGIDGDILRAEEFRQNFELLLLEHYNEVEDRFSNNIGKELSKEVAETSVEKEEIAAALALFFAARAGEQSQFITNTNEKDITESLNAGFEIAQETVGLISRQEMAVTAGAILARKLSGRSKTIALTETQAAAEVSKVTEMEVLVGLPPSVTGAATRQVDATREWVTVGDEKVRAAHVAADGQIRKINEPFIVDGEALRYPGDTSLGASAGNVINCRCSPVPNIAQIETIRGAIPFGEAF